MPRQPLRIAAMLAAATTLASCTTGLAMQGLNGVASCPPEAMRAANANVGTLQTVRIGQTAEDILAMGATVPEQKFALVYRDGTQMEVWYYRTGHPRCQYSPSEYEFTPVVVDAANTVQAVGANDVKPYLAQATKRKRITPEQTSTFSWARFIGQGTM